MHYGVSGRAPSILSAALALLLALGMHLFASRAQAADGSGTRPVTQVASAVPQDQPAGVL